MKFIQVRKSIIMKRVLSSKKSMDKGIEANFNTLSHCKKLIAIILFILLIILLIPVKVLLASNYKTGEHLKSWPIKTGEEFDIEYTHSVQLTPVIEIYTVDNKENIILKEGYFFSYGAGLPATTPYDFEITEDGFRVYNINQIMDNLIYRTGAVKANHKLTIRGKTYLFLNFSAPREGVKFTVENISLLSYLLEGVK